jgi:glycosyltransferase involved in cell wall biosynthesis
VSRRIAEVSPQLIYLNSFFSRTTIRVLLGRWLGRWRSVPILLSPRGEFFAPALAIKRWRKALYIQFVNAMDLLKGVTLQASSEFEKKEIEEHLSWARQRAPRVAANVSDPAKFKNVEIEKHPGMLKVLFLSRISRNKNLDGALQMLQGLQGHVEFSICGPIGDAAYYKECENLMWKLPQNIAVRYLGDVPHERVPEVLAENHLMFLPSHGENFGHAIAEALAAGRPVLISDRTPWRGLESRKIGADLSLAEPERFTAFLRSFVEIEQAEFTRRSRLAREYAIETADDPKHLQQSVDLIEELLRKGL